MFDALALALYLPGSWLWLIAATIITAIVVKGKRYSLGGILGVFIGVWIGAFVLIFVLKWTIIFIIVFGIFTIIAGLLNR